MRAMKAYGAVHVKLLPSLTSARDGGDLPASRRGHFNLAEIKKIIPCCIYLRNNREFHRSIRYVSVNMG